MPKARISLNEADRERLCCPEWLEIDIDDITIDESIQMEDALGVDLSAFLAGWPRSARTFKGMVWLGLRRAGVDVPLDQLTFKAYDWNRQGVVDEAGKDPEDAIPSTPPPDSPTS